MTDAGSVLVLGGTRFFGRGIVAALLDAGYRVTVLTRGNRPIAKSHSGLSAVTCDRKDAKALEAAVGGHDYFAVIDNICYASEDAEAAVRLFKGRCRHYLFTSTVMSYLNRYLEGRPIAEGDWPDCHDTGGMLAQYGASEVDYALSKRAAEQAFFADQDFPVTCFRLHNVIGADDFSGKSSAIPTALALGTETVLPGRPDDTYQFVWAGDIGPLYCAALATPVETRANAYNVANPPISQGDYVALVNAETGGEARSKFSGGDGAWGSEDVLAPFPRNVVLDTGLLARDFGPCLTDSRTYLPPVIRSYVEAARETAQATAG